MFFAISKLSVFLLYLDFIYLGVEPHPAVLTQFQFIYFEIKKIFLMFIFLVTTDRAGSISTLDSLDFARYSDDGNRETDERVAGE